MMKLILQKIRKILPQDKSEIEKIKKNQADLLSLPSDLPRILKSYKAYKEPGYALLITGDWGSGKTYQLTKKYLLPESYYYISLFGLKTADEIHAGVFSAMYPFKSSLKNNAEKLNDTGLEAYGISINFGNIAPQLISAFIKNKTKLDRIIIFDDFERCDIPMNERLGAINTYVEHSGCHVIVITNDEKISTQEFSEAKEKLFGSTFKIEPEIPEVFDAFLGKFKEDKYLYYIQKNKKEILQTLNAGGISSLRVLKQVLADLLKLYSCLEDEHLKNENKLLELTKFFTAISSEVRTGNFKKDELSNRVNHAIRFLMYGDNKEKVTETERRFSQTQNKYTSVNVRLDDAILSDEILINSLITGIFDKEKILSSINLKGFTPSESKAQSWRRMMDFDQLDDSTTDSIIEKLFNEFRNRDLTHPGDILHLVAFRLLMSKTKIIETDMDKTKEECLVYIEDVYNSEKLQPIDISSRTSYRLREAYDGYGYYVPEDNKKHFDEIYDYLISKIKMTNENLIIEQSSGVLDLMINNPEEFIRSISYSNNSEGLWAEKPILKNINVNDFVLAFLSCSRKHWHSIQYSLERRYEFNLRTSLISEVDWVISLVDKFEEEINKTNGIKKLRLERAAPLKIKELAISVRENNPN